MTAWYYCRRDGRGYGVGDPYEPACDGCQVCSGCQGREMTDDDDKA